MTKQYIVKVVTDRNSNVIYFNFGMSKHKKYFNVETCLNDKEYISITVYSENELEEYNEHVEDLLQSSGKLVLI